MQCTCNMQDLSNKLKRVLPAVAKRSTLEVLQRVLVRVKHDTIILAATDLDISLRAHLDAQVIQDGAVLVDAKSLSGAIASIIKFEPSVQRVGLILKGDLLQIRRGQEGQAKITELGTMPAEEFPDVQMPVDFTDEVPPEDHLIISPTLLKRAYHLVADAAASDESRPIFTAMCIRRLWNEQGQLILRFVTGDAFRLNLYELPMRIVGKAAIPQDRDLPALLPPVTSLKRIMDVLPDDEGPVHIYALQKRSQLFFIVGDMQYMACRQIEGVFPDEERVVPVREPITGHTTRLMVSTKQLFQVVSQVQKAAKADTNRLRIIVHTPAGAERPIVLINGKNGDEDDRYLFRENITLQQVVASGEDGTYWLNCTYLIDALKSLVTDKSGSGKKSVQHGYCSHVMLYLHATHPCFLVPHSESTSGGQELIQAIMPMSVSRDGIITQQESIEHLINLGLVAPSPAPAQQEEEASATIPVEA